MITKKILAVVLALILVAGMVVAGCAAPEEGKGPIKVGGPISMTGWYAADLEQWYNGTVLAIDEINAAGGLLGRPLELIVFDTENQEAEKVIAAAEKLVGEDKVNVLTTAYCGFGPDVEYFGRYEIPYFHGSSTKNLTDAVAADPNKQNIFMVDGHQLGWAEAHTAQLLALPYDWPNKKVATLYADDEWSIVYAPHMQTLLAEQGWEVVMDEVFAYGTREWGPLLTKLRPLDPALIIIECMTAEEEITFFQQFNEKPTNSLIWLGYGGANPDIVGLLGEDASGLLSSSWGFPLDTEKGRHFKEAYKKRYGMEPPIQSVTAGYDTIYVWAAAVEEVGDVTDYEAICETLRTGKFEGALGFYTFPPPGQFTRYGSYEEGLLPVNFVQYQGAQPVRLFSHLTPEPGSQFLLPPWIK